MMKFFLNFLVLIHIYTLLYFLFITIIYYDENFFEFFNLDSYIHIDVFSNILIYIIIYYNENLIVFPILKNIIKNLKLYI